MIGTTVLLYGKRAMCVHSDDDSDGEEDDIKLPVNHLVPLEDWWRRRDSKPLQRIDLHYTKPQHIHNRTDAIPSSIKQLLGGATQREEQFRTDPEQDRNSSMQSKCAKCVHQPETPEDLKLVVSIWQELPESVRGIILGLIISERMKR